MGNRKLYRTNTSGHRGIQRHHTGGWIARIKRQGQEIYLGHSMDFDEVVKMRLEAEDRYRLDPGSIITIE